MEGFLETLGRYRDLYRSLKDYRDMGEENLLENICHRKNIYICSNQGLKQCSVECRDIPERTSYICNFVKESLK